MSRGSLPTEKATHRLLPITLPPLTRDIQIDYTALSFVQPQRMGFRYILEGRDRGWENPGLRRQAFYSDLATRELSLSRDRVE